MQLTVTGNKKIISKAQLFSCPTGYQLRLESRISWPRIFVKHEANRICVDLFDEQGDWASALIEGGTVEEAWFVKHLVPFLSQKARVLKVHLFLGKQRGKLIAEQS